MRMSGAEGQHCVHQGYGCLSRLRSRPAWLRMCTAMHIGCATFQENNFKAVLESIRDLMNEETAVPPWLHDIFLGYGDPAAAQYSHMDGFMRTVDVKVRHPTLPTYNLSRCSS